MIKRGRIWSEIFSHLKKTSLKLTLSHNSPIYFDDLRRYKERLLVNNLNQRGLKIEKALNVFLHVLVCQIRCLSFPRTTIIKFWMFNFISSKRAYFTLPTSFRIAVKRLADRWWRICSEIFSHLNKTSLKLTLFHNSPEHVWDNIKRVHSLQLESSLI